MGYDLKPRNKSLENFHFGAFSFPKLITICGYLFTCIQTVPHWICVFGPDKRMHDKDGDIYPRLLSNDGFPVTALEAKIMSRLVRNFLLINSVHAGKNGAEEVDENFRETLTAFCEFAHKSKGFRIE